MTTRSFVRVCLTAALLPFALANSVVVAQTASYSVIANFGIHPGEGTYPTTSVVFDRAGNLFGTTSAGGRNGVGTAFELILKADGYWTEKTLANFSFSLPSSLVVDDNGNLYGTTEGAGTYKNGSVFKLSPSDDGSWTKTVLYNFPPRSHGKYPSTGVVFDKEGDLYGATIEGGRYNNGTIFKLSHQADGSWTETVLYSFNNPLTTYPVGLAVDKTGNLYGTARLGGSCSGVAFSLTKPELEGESWTYTTLHTFPAANDQSEDAICPGKIVLDTQGNLYGTSSYGGAYNGGTVFEIPVGGGKDGQDNILFSFNSANPVGGLVFDRAGNLYGTGQGGGAYGGGKIFELLPQQDGSWSVRVLHAFGGRTYRGVKGADGLIPQAGVAIGPDGNLYGTTLLGGYVPGQKRGDGTVFRLAVH